MKKHILILALLVLGELRDEANKYSEVLAQSESTESKQISVDVIRVRTVLEMGVEVPGVSNFSLNPEVELYFSP